MWEKVQHVKIYRKFRKLIPKAPKRARRSLFYKTIHMPQKRRKPSQSRQKHPNRKKPTPSGPHRKKISPHPPRHRRPNLHRHHRPNKRHLVLQARKRRPPSHLCFTLYRKCYISQKVTFTSLRHKRLNLHIADADKNIIPYEIYPDKMGQKKILKSKRLTTALKLCTGELVTVADKLRFARLSAGLHQNELAKLVGIERSTILRYENGQIPEVRMETSFLVKIALACGMDKYFCCNPYHIFIMDDYGTQIKKYRKSLGLTQKQFAEKLGVWVTTLKRWEYEKNKPPVYIWELVSGLKSIESTMS